MILWLTVDLDRNYPLRGTISKTYCGNCNEYINTYEIKSLSENYDMEAAYYLLSLLIPKKLDYAQKFKSIRIWDKLSKMAI